MNGWRQWLGTFLIYVLIVVYTAPAGLLDTVLAGNTQGRLRVTNATGTLWSGHGQIEIRTAANTAVLRRTLRWQLDPGQLLLARLSWQFGFSDLTSPGTLIAGWTGFAVSRVDLILPANAMAHLLPAMANYGLGGNMSLNINRLSFAGDNITGGAILEWQEASTALSPVSPLGNYELRMEGTGSDISLNLRTLQGPLYLDGTGSLEKGRRLDFSAIASVAPEASLQLAPFLRLFAVESSDGSFALQLN